MYGRLIIKYRDLKNTDRLRVYMSKWKHTTYRWLETNPKSLEIVWNQDNCTEVLKFLDDAILYFGKHTYLSLAPERGDYCKEYFVKASDGKYAQMSKEDFGSQTEELLKEEEKFENAPDEELQEVFKVIDVLQHDEENDFSVEDSEPILDEPTKDAHFEMVTPIEVSDEDFEDITDEVKKVETFTQEGNQFEFVPLVGKAKLKTKIKKATKKNDAPVKENSQEKKYRVATLKEFFLADEIIPEKMTIYDKRFYVEQKAKEWGIKSPPMIEAMTYAAIDSGKYAKKMEQAIGEHLRMNPTAVKASINKEYEHIIKEKLPDFIETYPKTTSFDFLNIFRKEENYF